MSIEFILVILLAYLFGSIPTAVLVSKSYHGIDVREHGSKNAGATNVFRVLGKRSGTLVLIIDILKGFTAANLILLFPGINTLDDIYLSKILLGIAAVIGHLYPVFAGFRGGKGIATLLGMVIALNPVLALSVVAVFLIVQMITHMVSAGSICAAASFSIFAWSIYGYKEPSLLIFGLVATLLVLFTHRGNIIRILNGTEKKIYLFKHKSVEEN